MYSYDIFAAMPCCAERLKVKKQQGQINEEGKSLRAPSLSWLPRALLFASRTRS
jgi:hypothetical protein